MKKKENRGEGINRTIRGNLKRDGSRTIKKKKEKE
jgi:hypothetical protein